MKKHNVDQKSSQWFQLRKGKITGTTLKAIMGTPAAKKDAVYELIAQRLTVGVSGDDYENAMDRGTRLEPDAVAMFELETNKRVEKVGFCENDDEASISNSPDGLIGETEAVEVKCPMGKNYVKIWFENEIPKEYYWQVVQYFVVGPKLKKLYFVAYNPDIPTHKLHIIEVARETLNDDIDKAREAQEEVIAEVNGKLKGIIKM